MLTSPTPSEYSILECPPISSLLMNHKTPATKWNCKNNNNMEIAPNCPRCASSNTKFCYYNNYSLSQPRYFCNGCRRYWTKDGSLRNLPVGGGCRKSRRARAAARRSGAQNHLTPSFNPVSAGSANESESGTDIDMAAVFARYVNQNVDENKEYSSSPGDSSGSSENFSCQLEEEGMMFEYQKEVDFHDQIQQVLVPHDDQISMHEEINGLEDFLYLEDSSVFGMQQGILGDDHELAADHMLWSSEGQDFPNFGSENGSTVQQIEDYFGLFSPDDDQLSISANLVADNWSSFDLSAYEFYSRP